MAEAYYEPTPATDGATMNPVPGAVFQVYEIADTSFSTPLSLRVGSGNPTTSVTASDTLATLPGVYVTSPNFEHIWKSGSFEWRRDSIDGAKAAIEDARISAANSAANAAEGAASELAARIAAGEFNGKDGSNVLPTSQAIAQEISTPGTTANSALIATFLPQGLVQNPVTKWYRADLCGAVGDTTTDNTSVFQGMVDAVVAAGGGTIHIPFIEGKTNIYRFNSLTISGTGNLDLTIQADPGVILRAAPLLTSDFITITATTGYLRRVTFRDLVIQGQESHESGTKIDRRGVVITKAQDVRFDNVKLAQFKRGALVLSECWDSYFNDVEIKWAGHGTSGTDYAHALQFLGGVDNSNNNRFTNLHMEFCPLEMVFDGNSRQNMFINFKLEHGGETEQNASGISPIWFKAGIENMFSNGQIVQGNSPNTYRIKADDNTNAYLSTYNIRQRNTFSNVLFFANSMNKARWFSGLNTTFSECQFQRTNGAAGGYGFNFIGRCRFLNCTVTTADEAAGLFRIDGSDNVITAPTIRTVGTATGILFTLISTALKTLLTDWTVEGSTPSAINTSLTYFGDNVVSDRRSPQTDATGGGTKSVLGKSFIKFTDTAAATYSVLAHGHNGQRVALFTPRVDLITIQHGTGTGNIALKAGVNKLMAANETVELVNVEGVWREV